jgi:hypothetical protein
MTFMKPNFKSAFRMLIVFLLFVCITGGAVKGQDVIIKKNGDEIKAKVEQVLDTEIKYRRSDNLTGPVYSISKAEVFMIRYENGAKDVFDSKPAPIPSQPQTGQTSTVKITEKDIQPAKTGSIINYAMVVPIMALGIISASSEESESAIGFGAAATIVGGIGIPVGALITSKTRAKTGVSGSPGLRIAGWIGYGLTIADAVTMLALSESVDFTGGPTISVAILGSLSSIFLAIDGTQTANQARSLASAASLQPVVGYVSDLTGNKFRTIGLRLNF